MLYEYDINNESKQVQESQWIIRYSNERKSLFETHLYNRRSTRRGLLSLAKFDFFKSKLHFDLFKM